MGHVNLRASRPPILWCLGEPEFDKEAELFSGEHEGDVISTMCHEHWTLLDPSHNLEHIASRLFGNAHRPRSSRQNMTMSIVSYGARAIMKF